MVRYLAFKLYKEIKDKTNKLISVTMTMTKAAIICTAINSQHSHMPHLSIIHWRKSGEYFLQDKITHNLLFLCTSLDNPVPPLKRVVQQWYNTKTWQQASLSHKTIVTDSEVCKVTKINCPSLTRLLFQSNDLVLNLFLSQLYIMHNNKTRSLYHCTITALMHWEFEG